MFCQNVFCQAKNRKKKEKAHLSSWSVYAVGMMPVETTATTVCMRRILVHWLAEAAHQAVVKGVLAENLTPISRQMKSTNLDKAKGRKVIFFCSTSLPVSKIILRRACLLDKREKPNNPTSCHSAKYSKRNQLKVGKKKKTFVWVDFKVLTNSSLLVNVSRHDSNLAFPRLQKDSF